MIFESTKLGGVFVLGVEAREDERGFFARVFCEDELERHGLDPRVSQMSISFNRRKGTLRGLHFQASPHEETKIVRCTAGAIFDVALDLRASSPTYLEWVGVELTASNRRMLYVPAGVAHGFQTLEDATEVLYIMSVPHAPDAARGVRWDDRAFRIRWPEIAERILSERDRGYPDFVP